MKVPVAIAPLVIAQPALRVLLGSAADDVIWAPGSQGCSLPLLWHKDRSALCLCLAANPMVVHDSFQDAFACANDG